MKLVVNFSDFADLISDPAVVISGEEVVYLNDMAKIAFSSLKVGENICKFLSLPIMYIETIGDAPYTFNYKGITYNVFTAVFNNETFLLFRKNSTLPVSPLLFDFQSSINLTTRIRDYLSQSFISFAALSKLMTEDDRERLGGTLSVMRRELFRELKLINHLDILVHAFSDKLTVYKSRVDLVGKLKALTEKVAELVTNFEIEVVFKNNLDTAAAVELDYPKIEIAVLCAISNAIKYTPKGSRVTVSAERSEDFWHICISDTGSGIVDPKDISIRRRFSLPPTFADPKAGPGLGISVMQEIIDLHGGALDISSAHGMGTTVTMTLPADDSDEPVISAVSDSTRNILVELSDCLDSSVYSL